jgi:oligopeptide/dipeptide ABC transporter ATP-binding protein
MSEIVLEVQNLRTEIRQRQGWLRVVDDISFSVARGEIVGLVGESGCGKSMTAFSLMQLFPTVAARIAGGRVLFEGRDLCRLSPEEMNQMRGAQVAMIFQDPATFLDPLMTLGNQIAEPLRAHAYRGDPRARTLELVEQTGLPDPGLIVNRYPHQVSGGQKQRALIASAMICSPKLLIADEPTTALDVTVQAQILDLVRDLRDRTGTAVLLITHDLGVIAEMCDRVYVMYAGRIVEANTTRGLFRAPLHPYTQGLLRSTVSLESASTTLFAIPGTVPNLSHLPPGCRFAPRCPIATAQCAKDPPLNARRTGAAACWNAERAAAGDIWGKGGRDA